MDDREILGARTSPGTISHTKAAQRYIFLTHDSLPGADFWAENGEIPALAPASAPVSAPRLAGNGVFATPRPAANRSIREPAAATAGHILMSIPAVDGLTILALMSQDDRISGDEAPSVAGDHNIVIDTTMTRIITPAKPSFGI